MEIDNRLLPEMIDDLSLLEQEAFSEEENRTLSPEDCFGSDAVYQTAKKKALDLLSRRQYTFLRLCEKLVERAFSQEIAQAAASRMVELGILDDRAYGEQYFAYLTEQKRFGRMRVRADMRQRGVPASVIGALLEERYVNWVDNALFWINKKYADCLSGEKYRRRAYQGLARYGFSSGEIRSAMDLYRAQIDEEEFEEEYG